MKRALAHIGKLSLLVAFTSSAWASDQIEVNLRQFQPGQHLAIQTDQGVIWVLYRTKQALAEIESSSHYAAIASDPLLARNKYRSIERKYFVVYPTCPTFQELPKYDQVNQFTCLTTGTTYDLTGRPISQSQGLAPMRVPMYKYKDKDKDQYTLVLPTK